MEYESAMFFTLNSLQLGVQFKMHTVSEQPLGKGRGKLIERQLLHYCCLGVRLAPYRWAISTAPFQSSFYIHFTEEERETERLNNFPEKTQLN